MGVIAAGKLSKSFGKGRGRKHALKDVSFEIAEGSMTALIGPDGAGKTTLLRLLAGILQPDSGEICVLGHTLPGEALRLQARIGYMPQRFGLYENLSVEENLTLFADLHNIPDGARRAASARQAAIRFAADSG